MIQRLALALCLVVPCGSALARDAASGRHVVIVLDASRHMARSLAASAAPNEPRWTRLGAAREAVRDVLSNLAPAEEHTVSLVLLGHRLAAQEQDGQSVTAEQPDYVRLTDGKFQRQSPDQDVEIVRESNPLTEPDLPGYQATLDALKPWGESPLLTAIERAVELAPTDKSARQTQIIVFTSGQIEPGESADADLAHLLDTIRTHHAAISIVNLDSNKNSAPADMLRQIAAESGGALSQPATAKEVAQSALSAATREEPRRIAGALRPQPVTAVFQEPPAPPMPPVAEELDQIYDILFEVTYYGNPVKDAEVIIHGDNFDLIYNRDAEYDKPSLRANRLAGKYLFKGVPLGSYTMEITANVKNRKHVVVRGFSADDDNKIPGMSFKIQLEKSKDPPPPAPAP
jgi:VWA domain-containing protein